MANKVWTYEETLIAFELYCRIPFSKINKSHPLIIELAEILQRTPSSVSMKLGNISRNDPDEIARGIAGLSHGAKAEEQVWRDFNNNPEETMYKAKKLLADLQHKGIPEVSQWQDEFADIPEGKVREAIVKQRIGQSFFREAVLSAYDNKCCVTGMAIPTFLTASHIKPWRDSNPKEKTDPHNGLCLNALHDRAFDQGLISVSQDYKILVSSKLNEYAKLDDMTMEFIVGSAGKEILLPGKFRPNQQYLEYHRDVIFRG